MYLATITRAGTKYFEIRQSFLDHETRNYRYRQVYDLGRNPADHIELISDDISFFSPHLEESVSSLTSRDPTEVLEELLWDFLPEEQKYRLGLFRHRRTAPLRPLSESDRQAISREVHLFDRRRLYYLRYGAVDQSRISRLNPKLYRPLLQQCRDEREYYFMKLEKVLKPSELKTYVFAIFDLQRHFSESFSSAMPEALNQQDIADHFTHDLCGLNADSRFWAGASAKTWLHHHLVRYLIMFFDYGYGRRTLFDDFVREFMGRHRAFTWPEQKKAVSSDDAARIFATEWSTLQQMNKRELTRLFRQRAKQLHPDSGGEHDSFIALRTAYASLLLRKK